jgi:hypothetical protein
MINKSKQYCVDSLSSSLARSANWQRALHTKYPNDPRNGRAAERLDQLANEANELSSATKAQLLRNKPSSLLKNPLATVGT